MIKMIKFNYIFHCSVITFNFALSLIHCFYFLLHVSLNAKAFVDALVYRELASFLNDLLDTFLIRLKHNRDHYPIVILASVWVFNRAFAIAVFTVLFTSSAFIESHNSQWIMYRM